MNVFYAEEIGPDKITLVGQEAQHCIKVLRKGRGEQVFVIDGCGHRYTCEIIDSDRRSVLLNIKSTIFEEKDSSLPHLAFGMIKNQTRLEWMLEKITELGVGRITPLICSRSEKRMIKRERLEKIILSATKQSLNLYFPVLDDPIALRDYDASGDRVNKYIACLGKDIPELSSLAQRDEPSLILIGPEGDFTEVELSHIISKGYRRVNMGKSRLRAETACIVGCTILHI